MSKVKTTEGEFRSQVITWLNIFLRDNPCPFELATADPSVKVSAKETRFPDVQLWINRKASQGFCGLELKTIDTAVDDSKLLENAINKARAMKAGYFVTWNMRDTIIWQTPKTGFTATKKNRVKVYPSILNINSTSDLWNPHKSNSLQTRTIELLNDLIHLYHEGHLYEIDVDATFFVRILSEATTALQPYACQSLREMIGTDISFRKSLYDWAIKQAVANFRDESFYEVISYQAVYRLLGKILFYQTLRRFREDALPAMDLCHLKSEDVQNKLTDLFELAREIDYQAVFEKDLLDEVELPNKSIDILVQLVDELNKRNFSRMPQDVIGQVFEQLIPPEERHNLGQYFTREDLVDLICAFCVQKKDASVLDPTCGTGTFLLRAYDRLRYFGEYSHRQLLSQLWGIDIAPFPAELATINLYRQNLSDYANFPKILTKDTFLIRPNQSFEFPPPKITTEKHTITEQMPNFDAIVGNFPYIRQELIERRIKGYKNQLDKVLTIDWKGTYSELFDSKGKLLLSGQADIYTYLFFHVSKLLNENGGRMGIVSSSAWLEVDYGYELQKFFLKNFKVIAVLETLAENWFEDVPIITVVTILERCGSKKDRNNNLVKFVKFKKPLREIIPQELKIASASRWVVIDKLVTSIEQISADFSKVNNNKLTNSLSGIAHYEDNDIRVRIMNQSKLQDDIWKSGKTEKWGIHIRAPYIYYEILEKCQDKFIKLGSSDMATLRYGLKSGINEFFFLDEEKIKHWGIEKEYLVPIITSPKEIEDLIIDPAKIRYRLFLCNKTKMELRRLKAKGALSYIEWGEKQVTKERGCYKKGGIPYPKVKSVINRKHWYGVGEREKSDFLINQFIRERFFFPINKTSVLSSNVVFEGKFNNPDNASIYLALLNSTLVFLLVEITSRFSMGDGFITFYGPDIGELLIPNIECISDKTKINIINAFNKLLGRPIKIIQEEVKMKDRQKFDAIVLKAVGLEPKKYLPLIYESLVYLVNERQNLGAMRKKRKKVRIERDIEKLKNEVVRKLLPDGIKQFPNEFLDIDLKSLQFRDIPICKEPLRLGNYLLGTQDVVSDGGFYYEASSTDEARYLIYAQKPNTYIIKIPQNETLIRKAVTKYEKYLKDMKNQLFETFFKRTHDHKLADILTNQIFDDLGVPEL
ncbi:MAG: N-6 DNA methylase [bacterium]